MPRQTCVRCNECFSEGKLYRCMDCVIALKLELSEFKEQAQPVKKELREVKTKLDKVLAAAKSLKSSRDTTKYLVEDCSFVETYVLQTAVYVLNKALDKFFNVVDGVTERKEEHGD